MKQIIFKKEEYQPEESLNPTINFRRFRRVNGKIHRGRQPQVVYMQHYLENLFDDGEYIIPDLKQLQMENILKQYQKKLNDEVHLKINKVFETIMSRYDDKIKEHEFMRRPKSNNFKTYLSTICNHEVLVSERKPQYSQAISVFRKDKNSKSSIIKDFMKDDLNELNNFTLNSLKFISDRSVRDDVDRDTMNALLDLAKEKFTLQGTDINFIRITEKKIFNLKNDTFVICEEEIKKILNSFNDNIEGKLRKVKQKVVEAVRINEPANTQKFSITQKAILEDLIMLLKNNGVKEFSIKF